MRNILILDNTNFSYICASILKTQGCTAIIVNDPEKLQRTIDINDISLIVVNYPINQRVFDSMRNITVPKVLLLAHINKEVVELLKDLNNTYCMIKPIDYSKFIDLIKMTSHNTITAFSGYSIL